MPEPGQLARGLPPTALAGSVAQRLAVVVAPATGRFRPAGVLDQGSRLAPGDLVGHVTGGQGRADEVRAPAGGAVGALLVRPGQLVGRGQGLLWLDREVLA